MRCEACMRLLDDFVDRELSELDHRKVEQHINECVQCEREAEGMRILSRDAASLPKSIQPEKDLWPGIEAEILMVSFSKNDSRGRMGADLDRKCHQKRAAGWRWWIVAAALLGTILLAGTYLQMRKQATESSISGRSSSAEAKRTSALAPAPSIDSLSRQDAAPIEQKEGRTASTDTQALNTQQPAMIAYPIDPPTFVSVSNHGIYGIRLDFDTSLESVHTYVIRYDRNGMRSWAPPLPPGSMPLSIYAGSGNQPWITYSTSQADERLTFLAELDFEAESIRNVWKSNNLQISRFVMSPKGLIYAAGLRNDCSRKLSRLTRGQSITVELMHIIDSTAGGEQHLFPMTLRPRFDSPNWAGQTLLEIASLTPTISVKSNGNFFLTIDRMAAQTSVRDLIKNEAVEYAPDGTVTRTWKLGTLELNAYLNRIFVDADDSILAEILRYSDAGATNSTNGAIVDRYLLRVDLGGRVTRCELPIPLDEIIQGWMGQTRDLVTLVRGKQPVIKIQRL
jgi:hypothetical protein